MEELFAPQASIKNCITVVIPTILKTEPPIFQYTLDQLTASDLVKHIVVTDNTDNKEFDHRYSFDSKTIVMKEPGNTGGSCTPGMRYCDTKYYIHMNDDVACHKNILQDCVNILEHDTTIGLIQPRTIVHQPLNEYCPIYENNHPQTKYVFQPEPKYNRIGWFQFGRTDVCPIMPMNFKYFYGDDLILLVMERLNMRVANLISSHISHKESSTISKCTPPVDKVDIERSLCLELSAKIADNSIPIESIFEFISLKEN